MKYHCKKCSKRVPMTRTQGKRLFGRGADAYYLVTYACQVCGETQQSKSYPNWLADVFSVPKR